MSNLSAVINGQKDIKGMSEGQAKSALAESVSKLSGVSKKLATAKENAGAAAEMMLHSAEAQGTTFLASMAEGYRATHGKTLKIGPVDGRLLFALPLQAWGLVDCLRGKGGGHQLAFGNGFMASALASLGVQAGAALAEKKAGNAAASPVPANEPAAIPVNVTPEAPAAQGWAGQPREVLLHPAATEGHRPRRARRV